MVIGVDDRHRAVRMRKECGGDRTQQQPGPNAPSPWLPATIIQASRDASISVGVTAE